MKLVFILISLNVVNSFASIYSQKVSLELQDVKFSEAISEIAHQTHLEFAYSKDFVDMNKKVSISVNNTDLKTALDRLVEGTELIHLELNGKIYLGPKYLDKLITATILQQQKVYGTITDAMSGEPLAGVTIIIEGTTQGVISDAEGKYSIEPTSQDAVLVFSFLGYSSEKVAVQGKNQIDITLVPDIKSLDEIIVVGYGSQKKIDITGSISSVKGADLTKVSAAGLSTAISGRLPGLQVTQNSGLPGSDANLKVRGVGSLYSDNSPLVLIDGFKGDLKTVDPNEVESITLLKDAASASIYGARAANGVVLVTTKHGKNESMKIDITAKSGFQWATNIPRFLDGQRWARKMNESTQNRNNVQYWVGAQAPELQTTSTDWFKYIFQQAPVQDVHATVSGGSPKIHYSVSLGYFDQGGILIGTSFKKANLRANMDYISRIFNFGVSISQYKSWTPTTTNTGSSINGSNIMYDAVRTPPTIPILNPDGFPGTPRTGYKGEDLLLDPTPSMDANSVNNLFTDNSATANIYAELKLAKGLKFRSVLNVTGKNSFNRQLNNKWATYKATDTLHLTVYKSQRSQLSEEVKDGYTWESENILTYTLDIKEHHFDALAGISAEKSADNDVFGTVYDLPSNDLTSLSGSNVSPLTQGGPGTGSISSQFGRLNYAFKNRYLAQVNVRRDGTSNFAPGHRWGVFPSASVGWRISEESFLKDNKIVSNLKLRAGYGSLGNAAIPSFRWLSGISFGGYVLGTPQTLNQTAAITDAYNENLKWEKTTTENLGVDLGLLQNKILVSGEIFQRKTTDLLLSRPLPGTAGVGVNPFANLGAVVNKGFEVSVEYNNNIGKLNYGISVNFTHVSNKVTNMAGYAPINESSTRTEEGQSINYYYGYKVLGIYQNATDISNQPFKKGAQPGDYRYEDLDKNDTIDSRDRTNIGNAIPQFYYGASLYLSWNGFDFSMLFQGEFDKKIMMEPNFAMDFGVLYDYANMYKSVYDQRWTGDGSNSYYPALGSGSRNNDCNDRWVQNASYLRVKSIQLGYTLPKKLTSKFHVQELRVFVTATNLFTFTKYPGFDPEMGGSQKRADGTNYMDKVSTAGGLDFPQAKVVQMGITIGL